MTTIAGFDIDQLADQIVYGALLADWPLGEPTIRLAGHVALEALGDVAPDQLSDGHALVECGQVKATEQLGG